MIIFAIQIIGIIGHVSANYLTLHNAISEVKQRISLDLGLLDLGTENINAVANTRDIARYIARLNQYLNENTYPLRVSGLSDMNNVANINTDAFPDSRIEILSANENEVSIHLATESISTGWSLSYIAFLLGFAYFLLAKHTPAKATTGEATSPRDSKKNIVRRPKLIIDLRKKALHLANEDVLVDLSNKPFCFYVALVRYCLNESSEPLVHHQPIPDQLVAYANETFQRLMELGHTKRRQPDFSTNLDKTLSEIRAALDEVFARSPGDKCHFYPPKAQGEGSRTKRHCYSLDTLNSNDIDIIFD
jgi:hypothetical protein